MQTLGLGRVTPGFTLLKLHKKNRPFCVCNEENVSISLYSLLQNLEVQKIVCIFAPNKRWISMSRKECIDLLKNCSNTLKSEYGITSLRLFGSTARDEQKECSDVDVFVETLTPNPFLLMEAKEFLEKSTGRSVDIIRNHRNLNPRLKRRIERDGINVF